MASDTTWDVNDRRALLDHINPTLGSVASILNVVLSVCMDCLIVYRVREALHPETHGISHGLCKQCDERRERDDAE